MARIVSIALVASLVLASSADAARVRVVKKGPAGRTKVTVRTGFPIVRPLPHVVVRTTPVVRVAPRVYLAPITFTAVTVAAAPRSKWESTESLEREDGWTDFTMNVNRRGSAMFLQIERGAAQVSFAEVVFDNGETQVVDFADGVHDKGVYTLLDFRNGREIDHVRVVAKAATKQSAITLHLAA